MADIQWWERTYKPGWPPESPEPYWWPVWVRSNGCCEYCGLDATVDARFLAVLDGDHIVPRCKEYEGSEDPLNIAIACRACNDIKRDYDPSDGEGPPRNCEDRNRLIEAARTEIFRRVNQKSAWEHPLYFRIWQLTARAEKMK